jgi:membrane-associated protease RseP (regulator of RpoE activity)
MARRMVARFLGAGPNWGWKKRGEPEFRVKMQTGGETVDLLIDRRSALLPALGAAIEDRSSDQGATELQVPQC